MHVIRLNDGGALPAHIAAPVVTNVLLSTLLGAEKMRTFETILLAFSGEIASQGGLTTEERRPRETEACLLFVLVSLKCFPR